MAMQPLVYRETVKAVETISWKVSMGVCFFLLFPLHVVMGHLNEQFSQSVVFESSYTNVYLFHSIAICTDDAEALVDKIDGTLPHGLDCDHTPNSHSLLSCT